jgi:hypothetical protein
MMMATSQPLKETLTQQDREKEAGFISNLGTFPRFALASALQFE